MAKDSLKIRPGDVTILKKLKESQFSVIFKVRLRDTICVMKVVSRALFDNLRMVVNIGSGLVILPQNLTLLRPGAVPFEWSSKHTAD